jgi:hypothetical protein
MTQVVVLLLVMLWAAQAHATTRYVRKGGNDAHSCSAAVTDSDANAKLTIRSALACTVAGDTVIVHAGTYDEGWIDAVNTKLPSGTASAHVKLTGDPGDTVTITGAHSSDAMWSFGRSKPEYWDFTNLVFNCEKAVYCFSLYKSSYFTFTDVEMKNASNSCLITAAGGSSPFVADSYITWLRGSCHDTYATSGTRLANCKAKLGGTTQPGCGSHGMYINTGNNTFEALAIYNTGKFGVTIYNGGNPRVTNNIIKNCVIHDWGLCGPTGTCPGSGGGSGVGFDVSDSGGVYQSVFYNGNVNPAIALSPSSPAKNIKLYNNTFYNVTPGSIGIQSGSTGAVLKNNLIQGTSAPVNSGSGTVCTDTLFSGGSGTMPAACTQTVTGAAKMANPGAGDFRLTAGSAAIDAGVTLSETSRDPDGVARPQGAAYDIGAYEFGGGAVPPPTGLPPAAPTAPVLSAVQKGGSPS